MFDEKAFRPASEINLFHDSFRWAISKTTVGNGQGGLEPGIGLAGGIVILTGTKDMSGDFDDRLQ